MGENYVFDTIRKEGEAIGLLKGKREGRKEGREVGREEAYRHSVLRILRKKFGPLPASIQQGIARVSGASRLERLLDEAAGARSLKSFAARLGKR